MYWLGNEFACVYNCSGARAAAFNQGGAVTVADWLKTVVFDELCGHLILFKLGYCLTEPKSQAFSFIISQSRLIDHHLLLVQPRSGLAIQFPSHLLETDCGVGELLLALPDSPNGGAQPAFGAVKPNHSANTNKDIIRASQVVATLDFYQKT